MAFPYPVRATVPLFLAPMAGVSEPPFRRLCRSFGADVVVSEFLSSEGLRRGIESVHDGAYFTPEERPIGIQLYGADADAMAEAARLVEEHYGPDFIDINFGCPVKKVVKRNGGSGMPQGPRSGAAPHRGGAGGGARARQREDPQRLGRSHAPSG
jgi:tRNA-dihydrouridine synthase